MISRMDYFAGLAMQAILQNSNIHPNNPGTQPYFNNEVAKLSWNIAMAMTSAAPRSPGMPIEPLPTLPEIP